MTNDILENTAMITNTIIQTNREAPLSIRNKNKKERKGKRKQLEFTNLRII